MSLTYLVLIYMILILFLLCSGSCYVVDMFVVKHLEAFPEDTQAFADEDEVRQIVEERGLQLDDSMCASCPPMSPSMQILHLFAHTYAGLEMLE